MAQARCCSSSLGQAPMHVEMRPSSNHRTSGVANELLLTTATRVAATIPGLRWAVARTYVLPQLLVPAILGFVVVSIVGMSFAIEHAGGMSQSQLVVVVAAWIATIVGLIMAAGWLGARVRAHGAIDVVSRISHLICRQEYRDWSLAERAAEVDPAAARARLRGEFAPRTTRFLLAAVALYLLPRMWLLTRSITRHAQLESHGNLWQLIFRACNAIDQDDLAGCESDDDVAQLCRARGELRTRSPIGPQLLTVLASMLVLVTPLVLLLATGIDPERAVVLSSIGIPLALAAAILTRIPDMVAQAVGAVALFHVHVDGFCPPAFATSEIGTYRPTGSTSDTTFTAPNGSILDRERARDLARTPEQLFTQLAMYTTADEVRRVRGLIDSGQFPLDHLDDLVHHRRAASLDERDVA